MNCKRSGNSSRSAVQWDRFKWNASTIEYSCSIRAEPLRWHAYWYALGNAVWWNRIQQSINCQYGNWFSIMTLHNIWRCLANIQLRKYDEQKELRRTRKREKERQKEIVDSCHAGRNERARQWSLLATLDSISGFAYVRTVRAHDLWEYDTLPVRCSLRSRTVCPKQLSFMFCLCRFGFDETKYSFSFISRYFVCA